MIVRYKWVPVSARRHVRFQLRFTEAAGPLEPIPNDLTGAVVRIEVVADEGAIVPVRELRDLALSRGAEHVAPIVPVFAKGELPRQESKPLPTDPLELLTAYASTNPPPPGTDVAALLAELALK